MSSPPRRPGPPRPPGAPAPGPGPQDPPDAVDPAAGTEDHPGQDGAARPTGRAALAAALRPRATRAQLVAAVLCAALGVMLVTGVREREAADLSSLRQSELISLLDTTAARADALQVEAGELSRTRERLAGASGTSQAAAEVARQRLEVLQVLAGTAGATGPGVQLRLAGPGVDADVLLSTVQELRDAGAEAIQLDDVRVVASTYLLTDPDGAVVVDGQRVQAPYVFLAVGDPATLASAMSFPGGVLPTVSARGGHRRGHPARPRAHHRAARGHPALGWPPVGADGGQRCTRSRTTCSTPPSTTGCACCRPPPPRSRCAGG